jgi:hypothetical protein
MLRKYERNTVTSEQRFTVGLAKRTGRKMLILDQIVLFHKIQLFSTRIFPQFAVNKQFRKKPALNVFEVQDTTYYIFFIAIRTYDDGYCICIIRHNKCSSSLIHTVYSVNNK